MNEYARAPGKTSQWRMHAYIHSVEALRQSASLYISTLHTYRSVKKKSLIKRHDGVYIRDVLRTPQL